MNEPNTAVGGFKWLIASLCLLACTSSLAKPGADAISEVEAYLDQIRTKVDSIQQSVDGVEEPPLAEKVVETFSFKTCLSLETLMKLGVGAGLEVPVKVEGKANPGAAIFQGLAKLHAKLNGSLSLGTDASLGAGYAVCFDLWKIGKALKEEIELQTAEEGLASRTVEFTGGFLGGVSPEAQEYLIGLSNVNPSALYNTLLDPAVNEVFGFNPGKTVVVAEALFDEMQGDQLIPDPKTMISDVEARLNKFADVLPFAELIDIGSLFDDPEKLNPCTYVGDIPFSPISDCSELQGAVDEVDWIVQTFGTLLDLANIKTVLDTANGVLNDIFDPLNSTGILKDIGDLINDLKSKKSALCNQFNDSVIDC